MIGDRDRVAALRDREQKPLKFGKILSIFLETIFVLANHLIIIKY
jgi:hypothetical protein